jgi:predicted amidohydrolase
MTRAPLTIAAAQPVCVSHDVAANALVHAETIRATDARVVVFPELSLTGYELDAPAMTVDDPRLESIVAACAEMGAVALVGAPLVGVDGAEGPFIAMFAIDGDGVTVAYRKIWLGSTETERFMPGREPAVIEVDGWRLGLAICKDTGIPQHAADTAAQGIDAYVAGSVKTVAEGALQDVRAQRVATRHGIWVVVASGAGPLGGGYDPAAGRSGIWAPGGARVSQVGAEPGAVARATLT